MIPRIGLCLLCLGHIKLIWPFLSDDVKKEAAKMMKKINEVAERSENLESQVIVWSGDQLLSVKCSGDDVHVWTWRFTWPQPVNAHPSSLLQLLSWSCFPQNWVVINVIKWENKSLRIVFLLLTLSAAVLPGKVLVKESGYCLEKGYLSKKKAGKGFQQRGKACASGEAERVLGNDWSRREILDNGIFLVRWCEQAINRPQSQIKSSDPLGAIYDSERTKIWSASNNSIN